MVKVVSVLVLLVILVVACGGYYAPCKKVQRRCVEGFIGSKELVALRLPEHSATWRTDAVPKIIHQTAPANRKKWHPLWRECQASWLARFPGHTYHMWTDEGIEEFIKTKYPAFFETFRAYDQNIKRIDAFRYFLLYEYGGIYADMDYQCVRDFATLLPTGKVSIAESMYPGDEGFQNALMASPAKHPFWLYVIDELLHRQRAKDVLYATGPLLIAQAVRVAPGSMVNALPRKQFSYLNVPASRSRATKAAVVSDASVFAIHHCTSVYV